MITIINFLSALLGPIIAIVGLYYVHSNHKLAQQKRKDELFDRRYALFEKILVMWNYCIDMDFTPQEAPPFPAAEAYFLIGKAGFLFDEEIARITSEAVGRMYTLEVLSGLSLLPGSGRLTKSLALEAIKKPSRKDPIGPFPRELFEKYLNVK